MMLSTRSTFAACACLSGSVPTRRRWQRWARSAGSRSASCAVLPLHRPSSTASSGGSPRACATCGRKWRSEWSAFSSARRASRTRFQIARLAIATRSLAIAALNVRVALEGVAVRRVVLKEDRVRGVSTALRPRTRRSAAYHAVRRLRQRGSKLRVQRSARGRTYRRHPDRHPA